MDKKSKKLDDKKMDKAKDRGDKINLLVKIFEELDIANFLPIRDRGDARGNFRKSSRNIASETATNYKNNRSESNKRVAISVSEVKHKKQDYILDSDDSSKKHHRKVQNIIKSKSELGKIDDMTKMYENVIYKKVNENVKIGEEAKRNDYIIKNTHLPPGKDLKFIEKDALERRKLLRQRYTVKLKSSNKNVQAKDSFKCDNCELKNGASQILDREKIYESAKDILLSETNKLGKKVKEQIQVQRKPMIKTIRNNDYRVYKAVTFIEHKETTPLQIKIPNSKKSVETNTVKNKLKAIASKESEQNIVKEKSTHTKKNTTKEKKNGKRSIKRPSSPVLSTYEPSLQTEVAKWAPSSVNQHTKPYYEAWVDTTLAAITKCSEKDKLNFNKQHIFRTFKRALELDSRPDSQHLIYDKMNDEKYMGKITVNKSK